MPSLGGEGEIAGWGFSEDEIDRWTKPYIE
jgi:hypothetical protein